MGETATRVQNRLRGYLEQHLPAAAWETEHTIAGTPVDVTGTTEDCWILVELEWRRADPVNNTAKLFRHLDEQRLDADSVVVCQLFTEYYDLTRGGHSSKRENATFVGRVAADALDRLEYHAVDLAIDPPKRGGSLDDDWERAVEASASSVAAAVGEGIE